MPLSDTHQVNSSLLRLETASADLVCQREMTDKLVKSLLERLGPLQCYGMGLGRVRDPEGAWEKSRSGSEELRSGREAEGLGFNSCVAPSCTQVSYFGKPIRQKRKQGEPKSIFRLETQEETPEYIY